MSYAKKTLVAVSALLPAILAATLAGAQPSETPAAGTGPFGEAGLKNVTLDETSGTVEAALIAISKQTGLGLAMTAAKADLEKPLTLVISDRPAGEVLDIIQASTDLELEMRDGILLVRSRAKPPSPEPGAAPQKDEPRTTADDDGGGARRWFDHPRWHKQKKRVEFGGPVVVEKGEHLHSAVSIGDTTTVFGHLDQDAVSIGSSVFVKSGAVVEGKAVAIGGKVVIDPGAVVEDEAVAIGGKVEVAEGGEVDGDRVSIPMPLPAMGGLAGAFGGLLVLHIMGAITRSIVFFGLALLLVWLIPRRLEVVEEYMREKPGISVLSGFLVFAALVPLFIVLAVTIIGIPLIPIAAIMLTGLVILGVAAVISWLGYKVPLFKENKTPVKAVIIGFVAFTIINLIPLLGCLFLMVATFAGVGAAFQSRFGGRPRTA